MKLQVAGFLDNSTVNGEGMRSVLFVSGCPHACPGCQNKEMQCKSYGETVDAEDIITRVLHNYPLIKGITLSGGEPFEQPEALLYIATKLKEKGLNVWCYTGYTYEKLMELSEDHPKRKLLNIVDVLVDGPFVQSQCNTNLKYRGSENQHIYTLVHGVIQEELYPAV